MITVQDAVREFGGRWQSPKLFLVVHKDGSYEFCDEWEPGTMLCSRVQFEQEAERQALEALEGFTAYTQPGFSGDPNDCAFKDEWLGTINDFPPVGTKCEVFWIGEWHETEIVGIDNGLPIFKTDWIERYAYGCGLDACFRPLKSDRERWVEAARDEGFPLWVAGLMYDKVTSGELPIPEVK